jgi:hypothetical protein
MWNAGPEPARLTELYTPAGFERFFADLDRRSARRPLVLDDRNEIGLPHGIRFFDDWIPELTATDDHMFS